MDHLNDLGEQAIKELSGSGGENLAAIERDVEQVKKSIQKSTIHQYTVLRLTIDGKRRAAWPQNASNFRRNWTRAVVNCVHDQVNRLADELIETSGNAPSSTTLRVKMLRLNNSWSAAEEKVRELENKMTEKSVIGTTTIRQWMIAFSSKKLSPFSE